MRPAPIVDDLLSDLQHDLQQDLQDDLHDDLHDDLQDEPRDDIQLQSDSLRLVEIVLYNSDCGSSVDIYQHLECTQFTLCKQTHPHLN